MRSIGLKCSVYEQFLLVISIDIMSFFEGTRMAYVSFLITAMKSFV
jgi:hypothetical protein